MKWVGWFILLTIICPVALGAAISYARGWPASWREADWSSSGLLADAATVPDARVIILASRTGGWKSIFAEHMSIVFKERDDKDWTRFEVVGWGEPVRRNAYEPDALWYGNRPYIVAEIGGARAGAIIPRLEKAISNYPGNRRGSYTIWPGPNSNTFVSWVVRNTEGLDVELPPAALGKDYLGGGLVVEQAASRTGFVASAWGLFGLTVALREGLEISVLGVVVGIDPDDLAIKLPALGKLSLLDAMG